MKRSTFTTFLYVAVFAVFCTTLFAAGDVSAVQKSDKNCMAAKCHDKMGKDKFVHGPIAARACAACHEDTGKHKFKKIKDVGKMCYKCHDPKDTMKNVHTPVKEGKCTDCHDPHESPFKFQLMADPPKLCFTCHDESMIQKKFVHGPVAVGGCAICHSPHQGPFPKQLIAEKNEVCFTCHSDKQEAFKRKKFSHEPVKKACVNCHDPHGGDYEFNFDADGNSELCFGCHKDKKDWIAKVKTKHGGLDSKKKCLACHTPHVSNFVKQLTHQPIDLCNTCHDKALDTEDGRIMDMKTYLAENKDYHGPIRQKDCSACHNTHGSNNYRMLRQYFPPVFYAPFDAKNYALCFNCHEKTLVQDPKTKTLTNFRNGDQNLHFVHVNKKVKGRTCRACHDAHATKNPKHVRDGVPFGGWELPIAHTITKNGGSCTPGCHQTFDYDRKKAVKNR